MWSLDSQMLRVIACPKVALATPPFFDAFASALVAFSFLWRGTAKLLFARLAFLIARTIGVVVIVVASTIAGLRFVSIGAVRLDMIIGAAMVAHALATSVSIATIGGEMVSLLRQCINLSLECLDLVFCWFGMEAGPHSPRDMESLQVSNNSLMGRHQSR